MNGNIVKQALEILDAAFDHESGDRMKFIEEACGENEELKHEVLRNLHHHTGHTLISPSLDQLPEPELAETRRFAERYELKEKIASGGVGRIQRAFDRDLGRIVAVKFLRAEYQNQPGMVRRFIIEAQISALLSHPGITSVYEIGRLPEAGPFIAMKLVEGETFSSLLRARTSPQEDLANHLETFQQVCQTIAFAHSKGVIHRDLKPDNVMVSSFGEVQVMDWGLAKLERQLSHEPHATNEVLAPAAKENATRLGTVMGTPAYMPPEQSVGVVRPQLDVFALGAILCEILTGSPPYSGQSPKTQLGMAIRGDVGEARTRLQACDCDEELKQIALDCLNPDPHQRPPDAGALADRTAEYVRSRMERARQAELEREKAEALLEERRRRSRVKMIAAAAVVGMGVLGAVVLYLKQLQHSQQVLDVERNERAAAEEVSYWATMLAAYREFNAGNNYQASQILEKSPQDLRNWEWRYLRGQIDSSSTSFEVPDRRIKYAALTDGGQKLLLMDGGGPTLVVDPDNGELLENVDSPRGRTMAVSDDGELALSIAFEDPRKDKPKRLLLWRTRSGEVEMDLGAFPLHAQKALAVQCQISPDKKYISFSSTNGWMSINLRETATGSVIKTFEIGLRAGGCAFSPDGKQFAYCSAEKIHFWDLENQCVARPPYDAFARVLKFSPSGDLLVGLGAAGTKIWDLNSDRVVTVDVSAPEDDDLWTEFSRDETQLIVPGLNDVIQKWNTETAALVSTFGLSEQISGKLGPYSWRDEQLVIPSVTGDDSVIRFWTTQEDQTSVLTGHTSFVYPVRISSDGKTIVSGAWDKTVRIWNGDTREQMFICEGHDSFLHDLAMDEKNQRIVSVDHRSRVCLWNLDTGERLASRDMPTPLDVIWQKHVAYSPDGSSILLISESTLYQLKALDLSTQKTVPLLDLFEAQNIRDMKISPSGKHLGVIVIDDYFSSIFHLLDLENLSIVQSLSFESEMQEFEFSPDEQELAFGSKDGTIELRSMKRPQRLLWLGKEHNREVFALKFLPDGTRLFTGGRDGGIRIWDTKNGTVFGPLVGHADYIYSMDISDDGHRLVSGSGDATLRIWQTAW